MGLHCLDTGYFANCWVRMYPSSGNSMASTSISGPPSNSVGNVCTVKRETGMDLEQHRRQGHWRFHLQCLECAGGRSVFQHRRKRDGQKETDFFPSNARWLSPGRLTNRKYNCIWQIQRIRSVATSVLSTVCNQKRTDWIDT